MPPPNAHARQHQSVCIGSVALRPTESMAPSGFMTSGASSDSDQGDCATGNAHRRASLRSTTRKQINARRVGPLGCREGHLQNFVSRFEEPLRPEEQAVVGKILNSASLMKRSCELLRDFSSMVQSVAGAGAPKKLAAPTAPTAAALAGSPAELMNMAARLVHQVKFCTARACWRSVLRGTEEEMHRLKTRYQATMAQFQEGRASFLKESELLREQARCRPDPEKDLDAPVFFDVTYFLDPVALLTPEESEFALAVVKEKLKMIFEHNPTVSQVIDFGQLQRWKDQVENHQLTVVKKALERKNIENAELRVALVHKRTGAPLRDLPSRLVSASPPPDEKPENDINESLQAMASGLESQVTELQAKVYELETALRSATGSLEGTQRDAANIALERDEQAEHLKQVQEELVQTQAELEEVRASLQECLRQEETLRDTCKNLRQRLKDLNESNAVLQRTVTRLHARRGNVASGGDDGALLSLVEELRSRDSALERLSASEEENNKLREELRDQTRAALMVNAVNTWEHAQDLSSAVAAGLLEAEAEAPGRPAAELEAELGATDARLYEKYSALGEALRH
eukprot:TRINITY_DN15028_c0_g1_i2.p1 TRINITY_DN15028_c0_g1~~TRINITY_DN15028_c0_g1_i2.p1  ORF type:complete len:576 (-),score=149.38 TRINITY_DN15028_c0_g1_i2:70-1797(-)